MASDTTRIPLKVDIGGQIQREVLLAEPTGREAEFRLASIPAFIDGIALGDTVKILDENSGQFRLVAHGGQVSIRLYLSGTLDRPVVTGLINELVKLNGTYEVGKNASKVAETSLLLLSVGVAVGFPRIEKLMAPFCGEVGQWEYGNVYDSAGVPLGWWKEV